MPDEGAENYPLARALYDVAEANFLGVDNVDFDRQRSYDIVGELWGRIENEYNASGTLKIPTG